MKITCDVIQDLMPSYIDGILSEDSKVLVEEHIGTCQECRKMYEIMKEEQGKECMGRELGTIREAKIPTFFVALGKEVAASGLDFVTWKEQNPEALEKVATPYLQE